MARLSDAKRFEIVVPEEPRKTVRIGDVVAPRNTGLLPGQREAPRASFPVFQQRQPEVGASPDLDRILELPLRKPLDLDSPEAQILIDYEMRKYGRENRNCRCREIDPRRECITRLLPIQAWMLYEMATYGGVVCAVPAGQGKSLSGALAPLALGLTPKETALLLVPSNLLSQFRLDYQLFAEHFSVPNVAIHESGNKSWQNHTYDPALPVLHVLPYHGLSSIKSSDWIDNLEPAAVICDEVDLISSIYSARTKRVRRYLEGNDRLTEKQAETRRAVKFCGWTGSLSDAKIMEFAHICLFAFRERSPLPLDTVVVEEWGRHLDAVPNPCPAGELVRLCEPGEETRAAFRRRLAWTPGMIVMTDSEVRVSGGDKLLEIEIAERKVSTIPPIVLEALAKVRNNQRPDTLAGNDHDEELVDPMSVAKCAQEVATGMFYRWKFPRGEPKAVIDEWFGARKLWFSELREKAQEGAEFLDSPGLCQRAAARHYGDLPPEPGMPTWEAGNWEHWRDVEDTVHPVPSAVRLHPFLVEDAIEWATTNRGIVWYQMVEFATWIHELSGIPMHTGGKDAGERISKERGDRSILASMNSHGRGRDGLQHAFNHQLVANMPSSGRKTQQLLARLHRRGQRNDSVLTEIYLHTSELKKSLEQALRRGEFVKDLFGETQKLLSGWKG